ncbi:acyl-CoA N-acyltransferase [Microthyrium microscopicum]|uniref:Acyl-CoA N-acyltransferase n=1 Tax=Microthyrium microscopicum TaxID=703497 RepID=A0A6A6TZK3_9PEZI|nr:acyl-CoA N-acyltransferase [Microthyrium microscopicum]
MAEPGARLFVAEDEDQQIMGYAIWKRKGTDQLAQEWLKDSLAHKMERKLIQFETLYYGFLDRAVNQQAKKQYAAARLGFYQRLEKTGYWHLQGLAVSPQHQRKGVGADLMQWGLKRASEESIPATLESSIIARGLYAKLGFAVVEQKTIKDGLDNVGMLWEAERQKGIWLDVDDQGNTRLKNELP